MLTHSKIPKFAFIGTSSSGKTTATYQTCGALKEMGIRVDGILQQDRRLPFDPSLLETHAEAQYWFITNMMTVENYLVLQKGVDCIVSDRSAVDFFAYAATQWPGQLEEMRTLVMAWAATYDQLFYLPPRVYDNDGVRPSDTFRNAVDQTLVNLISTEPVLATKVVRVKDVEDAINCIAVATKRGQLHKNARLTGSRYIGNFSRESDFDFIILESEWHEVSPYVRSKFVQLDHRYWVHKHNDVGLIAVLRSDELRIDVQVQQTTETLQQRITANIEDKLHHDQKTFT